MSGGLRADRLAIGTAQFGLPYGIANQGTMVSRVDASEILAHARDAGSDTLDTAVAYGSSEEQLGSIGVAGWRIISKLPALPAEVVDVRSWVFGTISDSLSRLRVPSLRAMLLHRPGDLLSEKGDALYAALGDAKAAGNIELTGISIYDPGELDMLMPRFAFDLVQSPFNIFDRRIQTTGWLERLAREGVEVHVRSAFLQGLLLMRPESRHPFFNQWPELWQRWDQWHVDVATTALDACINFVRSHANVDRIVVGVNSVSQLREIIDAFGRSGPVAPGDLQTADMNLLDPSRWLTT